MGLIRLHGKTPLSLSKMGTIKLYLGCQLTLYIPGSDVQQKPEYTIPFLWLWRDDTITRPSLMYIVFKGGYRRVLPDDLVPGVVKVIWSAFDTLHVPYCTFYPIRHLHICSKHAHRGGYFILCFCNSFPYFSVIFIDIQNTQIVLCVYRLYTAIVAHCNLKRATKFWQVYEIVQ